MPSSMCLLVDDADASLRARLGHNVFDHEALRVCQDPRKLMPASDSLHTQHAVHREVAQLIGG
jgi:hypothetical protein